MSNRHEIPAFQIESAVNAWPRWESAGGKFPVDVIPARLTLKAGRLPRISVPAFKPLRSVCLRIQEILGSFGGVTAAPNRSHEVKTSDRSSPLIDRGSLIQTASLDRTRLSQEFRSIRPPNLSLADGSLAPGNVPSIERLSFHSMGRMGSFLSMELVGTGVRAAPRYRRLVANQHQPTPITCAGCA
jgi:hypothetical protein